MIKGIKIKDIVTFGLRGIDIDDLLRPVRLLTPLCAYVHFK